MPWDNLLRWSGVAFEPLRTPATRQEFSKCAALAHQEDERSSLPAIPAQLGEASRADASGASGSRQLLIGRRSARSTFLRLLRNQTGLNEAPGVAFRTSWRATKRLPNAGRVGGPAHDRRSRQIIQV